MTEPSVPPTRAAQLPLHPVGTRFGPYVVEEVVGQGAMAVIYKVRHEALGSTWACKVLRPELRCRRTRVRILREAWIQSRVRHPGVVRTIDLTFDRDFPCPVLELVEGITLRDRVRRDGPLEIHEALQVMHDLIGAVAAAHQAGIVHRDIKPSNVLLEERGDQLRARLTDFGIACGGGWKEDTRVTVPGQLLGTPGFMAPEQYLDPVLADSRADVFSLGCVLFWAVCGRGPYDHARPSPDKHRCAATARYTPPRQLRPELPDAVVLAIRAALEPDPRRRIPSARQLLRILDGASLEPVRPPTPRNTLTLDVPPQELSPWVLGSAITLAAAAFCAWTALALLFLT